MRHILAGLILLGAAGCRLGDSLVEPLVEFDMPGAYSVLDGTDERGNPGFYWLPPVGPGPSTIMGQLDATVLSDLSVSVCEMIGDTCVGEPVETFTASGNGSDKLRISGTGEDVHFQVVWHTRRSTLDPARPHRVRVLLGDLEIGHADVLFVQDGGRGRGVDDREAVLVRIGRALPIQFLVTDALEFPPDDGLISWWKAESNPLDSRGGNHGTLQSGVAFGAGQVGQAFSYDGTGAVWVADDPSLRPEHLTIEAWIRGSGSAIHYNFIGKSGSAANLGYEMSATQGNARFTVLTGTTQDDLIGDISGTTDIFDGEFHHIVGTFDGTAARIYVDGVLEGVDPFTGSILHTTGPLYIGRRQCLCSAQVFDGSIDEVRIYGRALSGDEVHAAFAAGGG